MSNTQRLLYAAVNAAWGASLGTCAALLAYQAGAWAGRPSGELVLAGGVAIFGAAYVATVTGRGQRATLRGVLLVVGSAAAVYASWALAATAPGWVIVWVVAAVAGMLTGLLRPLSQ